MDKQAAQQLIDELELFAAAYPHRPMPEKTIQSFAIHLSEYPIDHVIKALRKLPKTSVFPPSIAEIIEEAEYIAQREWAKNQSKRKRETVQSVPWNIPPKSIEA